MQANFSLTRPTVPVSQAVSLDLLVTFNAGSRANVTRRPLNLSLVLDRSGSMAGTSLKHAIGAAQALVERLSPEDRLALVTYDDKVSTIFPPQEVKDKAAIRALLGKVHAGGCTNLSGGWLEGCKHVGSAKARELVNRVLLLTDGQANEGVTDPKVLTKTAKEKAAEGIITTTLGFGTNFNEDLLISMATAGEGHFYFIQSPDDAANVFAIELEGLASVAAQNLRVTLKPAAGVSFGSVLNRYPTTSSGGATEITLGDVYGVEDKQLVMELNLSAQAKLGEAPVALLSYSYDTVEDGSIKQFSGELPITVQIASEQDAAAVPLNFAVALRANQLRIAQVKEEAIELADKGDYVTAAIRLRQVIASFSMDPTAQSFEMGEEIDQLDHYAKQFESKSYDGTLRKELRDQSYQGRTRSRGDLALRGTAGGSTDSLPRVSDAGTSLVLRCVREGGKLHVYAESDKYDKTKRVQFPRSIREEGVAYLVDELLPSVDGSFYRPNGAIRRLVRPGEEIAVKHSSARKSSGGKAATAAGTAADLPTVTAVGTGVLVQCVKEGSKLRARVVSDGFDPNYNMRFPRSIREENTLYVVDEVITGPDGGSYIAMGKIHRLVQ